MCVFEDIRNKSSHLALGAQMKTFYFSHFEGYLLRTYHFRAYSTDTYWELITFHTYGTYFNTFLVLI